MARPGETEVFPLDPETGKCYEYAEATRKIGSWSQGNERYFTANPMRYVGRFVRTERRGWGDGGEVWSIFVDNNGVEHRVDYSYEGTTSFREVPCKEEVIKAARNVWSSKTGTAGEPGSGPANMIAKFLGGSRRLRKSRKNRTSKKTRKSRNYRKNRK